MSAVVVNDVFSFFRSLYLPNLNIQSHSGSSLTPKLMTFNDLELSLCVKIWFGLGIQWVRFRRILLGNLQSYAYTVTGKKNAVQRLYW